jgi:hypothetical protein
MVDGERYRSLRWTTACSVALTLLSARASADALDARTDAHAGAPRDPATTGELPHWSVRVSVGGGAPVPTVHEELLRQAGYGAPRWMLSGALERRFHGAVGVGVMGSYGFRTTDPEPRDGAEFFVSGPVPTYSERFALGAFEVPLTFQVARHRRSWVEVAVVPWAGMGWGTAAMFDAGAWRAGPAVGASLRLLGRTEHVAFGVALGAYTLPTRAPSSVAGTINFGTISLSLVGGFDAG